MHSLSIYVVAYTSYFPFYCRVVFYFMDMHNLFVYLPGEGHFSCFQLGATVNKYSCTVFLWAYVFIYPGKIPRRGIAGSYRQCMLT